MQIAPLPTVLIGILCLCSRPGAQEGRVLNYLNDKIRIPESERFDDAAYIATGVGLSFGVDRRLNYYAGNYEEAVVQFERAVSRYAYKSEIWVYLSRSYFFEKEPGKAQEALRLASEKMPDLTDGFWQPLLAGLNLEIRKRANDLQVQVDYYSKGQEEYHNLFRLYRHLEDYASASGVIHSAESRARTMTQYAGTSSGNSSRAYLGQAQKWWDLGTELRGEMEAVGIAVVGDRKLKRLEVVEDSVDEHAEVREATRLLQLRVDYYQFLVTPSDYRELFDNYITMKDRTGASAVIESIDRATIQLEVKIAKAVDYQDELDIQDEIATFTKLKTELRNALRNQE